MPYGWRFAGRRRPCSAQNTRSGSVGNTGVSRYAPSGTGPLIVLRLEHRLAERLDDRLGTRADSDHDVAKRCQLLRHLLRRARLVEERAQADRRLGVAHLLEQRQLERALHRDDAAVVHRLAPEAPAQALDGLA